MKPPSEGSDGGGLFLSADWRFSHDYFTGMCTHLMHEAFGQSVELVSPHEIIAFQNHLILAEQSYPHVRNNLLAAVEGLTSAHDDFVRQFHPLPVASLAHARGSLTEVGDPSQKSVMDAVGTFVQPAVDLPSEKDHAIFLNLFLSSA